MIFNTSAFLVFFVLVFTMYWVLNNHTNLRIRNLFVILASYVFYGWWDYRFLGLIVISSAVDYVVGLQLGNVASNRLRKVYLAISVGVNIGMLGFFKYYNFFVDSLSWSLRSLHLDPNLDTLHIILPAGISFYTFQTLSYSIDIYRKKLHPTKDILSFFAFVSFFPQLVAGPIERASHLLGQFREVKQFNYSVSVSGLRLVLWGFFKKIVIADHFGVLADQLLDNSSEGYSVIFGVLFFGIQIYADFSAYSDIAIGLSRLMGFDLMSNFKTPYFASSFTEFWHRWHISLSTWFRDYVFIPLGGSRQGKFRTIINLMVTFLLSGLWHGASVVFIIWGALHGLVLIFEKLFANVSKYLVYKFMVPVIVFAFWLPFRAGNYKTMSSWLFNLTKTSDYDLAVISSLDVSYLWCAIVGFFILIERILWQRDFNEWVSSQPKVVRWSLYYILLLTILTLGTFTVKPDFIYFQF